MASTYDTDFYSWTQETAQRLRDGTALPAEDLRNVIEEIEDLGRHRYDSLVSHLAVYFLHKLKWDYQPDRRTRSWQVSMRTAQVNIRGLLEDNPGLQSKWGSALEKAYRRAKSLASIETDLPETTFPAECPYSL
ncbi:MAG TPA: DUF29 domain-containing protein [Bryobacteraceae bacterium]|jgi:hypothetical protein|nr:DUF29 domain-containing protein [Bryobacteraceae bacterium]